MVGNACEINEAIEVLEGHTTSPLATVTLRLCSELLIATGKAKHLADAESALIAEIATGRPLHRLQQMVEGQGGRFQARLPLAAQQTVVATQTGYIGEIEGRLIGQAIIELGGGRKALGDRIDHTVGIEMLVRACEHISAGQPIVNIFAPNDTRLEIAQRLVSQAIHIVPQAPASTPLIVPLPTSKG